MKKSLLSLFFSLLIVFPTFAQKPSINGTYTMKVGANSATIAVEFNENFNTVKIQGDATWVGDAETGQVNVGEISGVFPLEGNSVKYYELLEDAPEDYCKFTITFGTKSLTVNNDNGQCGGMNVSFNGKYKRTGAAPKKWAAFEEKFSKQLAPIGGEFGMFWTRFHKAVTGKNAGAAAESIAFPLEGVGHLISDENPTVDKMTFMKNFSKVFPSYALKVFKKQEKPYLNNIYNSGSELSIAERDFLPDEFLQQINATAPIYVIRAGKGDNEIGFAYYFAKVGGQYKLALIQLVG